MFRSSAINHLFSQQTFVLINVDLQMIGNTHLRLRTQWTTVHPTIQFQGGLGHSAPGTSRISGVVVFVPEDPVTHPVFMFVNYINGKRARVSPISNYSFTYVY